MIYEQEHPIERAVLIVRAWLVMVTLLMFWNSVVANGYLLHGWVRPLPYLVVAVSALLWFFLCWRIRLVIITSSLICVAVSLRAAEVVLFATGFDMNARLTGASMWLTIGGTALAFGVLNVLMASRKAAEREVWDSSSSAS